MKSQRAINLFEVDARIANVKDMEVLNAIDDNIESYETKLLQTMIFVALGIIIVTVCLLGKMLEERRRPQWVKQMLEEYLEKEKESAEKNFEELQHIFQEYYHEREVDD